MNLGQMKERAGILARMALRVEAPAPDWTSYINEALQKFAWEAEYNSETTTITTVINQSDYALALPYWKYLQDVVYSTTRGLYQTNEQQERMRDPLYLIQPAGSTERYYMAGPNTLRLLATPTEAVTLTIRGIRAVPSLALDADIPGFPDVWHDALSYKAAVIYCEGFASNEIDAARVDTYEKRFQRAVKDCDQWNDSENAVLQRTQYSRLPDRVLLNAGAPLTGFNGGNG
jgi:hypothetical protein